MADYSDVPMHRLVDMYCNGEISADDYYADMERRGRDAIRQEIADESKRQARAARHA